MGYLQGVIAGLVLGMMALTVQAENQVSIDQVKRAAGFGAECSGFYDGLFAVLHKPTASQTDFLQTHWSELGQRTAFLESTAAMLMTDIFIRQINRNLPVEKNLTLEDFSQLYVSSRQRISRWQGRDSDKEFILKEKDKCMNIINIVKNNGTLTPEMLKRATAQRAKALGVDLEALD